MFICFSMIKGLCFFLLWHPPAPPRRSPGASKAGRHETNAFPRAEGREFKESLSGYLLDV